MKDSNLNILKEEVQVLGVKLLDFKSNDGNVIRGYKVFYSRNLTESEKENTFGKMCEYKFLPKENLDDADKYRNKVYPVKAILEYQVVSLNSMPKLVDIKF